MIKSLAKKVAIIGIGHQGEKHLNAALELQKTGLLKIVGVCNTIRLQATYSVPTFNSYLDLFDKAKPEIIIISVPNNLHDEISTEAMRRGIHVIKEKPLSTTYTSALQLINQSFQTNTYLFTTQQRYYSDLYMKSKSYISKLGIPASFNYVFTLNDIKNSWRWNLAMAGGGTWLNMGWHAIAMIQWLLGEVSSIEMSWKISGKRSWFYNTDHTAFAKVILKNGTVGTIFVSCAHPVKQELLKVKYPNQILYLSRNNLRLFKNNRLKEVFSEEYSEDKLYFKQLQSIISDIDSKRYNPLFDLYIMKTIQMGIFSASFNSSRIRINNTAT